MSTFLQQTGATRLARLLRLWRLTADDFIDAGVGSVQVATRILNNTEIKALPSTPIMLLSALQSATRIRVPVSASVVINTKGGLYTNVANARSSEGAIDLAFQPASFAPAEFPLLQTALDQFSGVTMLSFPLRANAPKALLPTVTLGGYTDDIALQSHAFVPTLSAGAFDSTFNTLTVRLWNYDGAFETDRGDLTGGHASNWMAVSVVYHTLSLL